MQDLDKKVDQWKKRLLDLGKRNRLINFKETKRSNIAIISPNYDELYKKLVSDEDKLSFPFPSKTTFDEDGEEVNISVEKGDIDTNKSLNEQQKTLKVLRARAKTSIEEQGINCLYLTFGIIRWKESDSSDIEIASPIVLVPVTLTVESITDPYILQLHEDEIVVNPSLAFKFENDFGIDLPEFDGHEDDITEYLSKIRKIARKNDWEVSTDVNLTLLSFLKINMYKDLDNNKDKIVSNPIIKALSGDKSEIVGVPSELNNFDHDKNIRPIDTYQVVDADSSQQDAILLSKRGISFVLQGPPGTGKSQTITNIISEAISDGKKVLFVSEKMAALEVVKKRLTEAGLQDFCLTLHSYKANKKEVLNQLAKTLNVQRIALRESAIYQLSVLEEKRKKLNEYQDQLHQKCLPLNISIYEANGRLAKLSATQDIVFGINNVESTDITLFNTYKYLLTELSKTIGKLSEDYADNPWYGCNVPVVTHELRHDIEVYLQRLVLKLKDLVTTYEKIIEKTGANKNLSLNNIPTISQILDVSAETPGFPVQWISDDVDALMSEAQEYLTLYYEHKEKTANLLERYIEDIFQLNAHDIISTIESKMNDVKGFLDSSSFPSTKDIVLKADFILNECREINDYLQNLCSQNTLTSSTLGLTEPSSINDIKETERLIELILKNPQPLQKWFNYGEISRLIELVQKAESEQKTLSENLKKVTQDYDERILEIDASESISCFNNSYSQILKIIGNFYSLNNNLEVSIDKVYSFADEQSDNLEKSFVIVKNSFDASQELSNHMGIKSIPTIKGIASLTELLSAVIQNPKPTLAWFDDTKEFIVDKIISDLKTTQQEIQKRTNELLQHYNHDILGVDYKGMLVRFNTQYTNFLKYLKGSYRNDKRTIKAFSKDLNLKLTDIEIVNLLNNISAIKEKEQWLIDNKSLATEMLGGLYIDSYTNWELIDKCRANFKVIKNYFGVNKIPEQLKNMLLNNEIEKLVPFHSILSKVSESNVLGIVEAIFGVNSGNLSIQELLNEMQNTANSSLEIKAECENILKFSVHLDTHNTSVKNVIDSLLSVMVVNQKRTWFSEHDEFLSESFGSHYIGENTDWSNIHSRIDTIKRIIDYFGKRQIPSKLIDCLTSSEDSQETFVRFKNSIDNLENKNIVERLNNLLITPNNETADFNDLIDSLEAIDNGVNISYSKYVNFSNCARTNLQFETIMTDIILLYRIQEIESLVEDNSIELKSKFNFVFDKMNTKWEEVISSLEYVKKFNNLCQEHTLSQSFINDVANKNVYTWATSCSEKITEQNNDIYTDFKWYADLFEVGDDFFNVNAYTLTDKIQRSLNNLSLLEEWIDFRSIRQQCREIGLSEFVEKVEQVKMHPEIIVDTFLKRFYRLWLDVMIPRYPAVYAFRSRSHQSLINEFIELDKEQLKISRLRILERLLARLPNTDMATSSVDEVGILKRELTKQRKIMPLRKLFKSIPNLLTALKPCLMMSPLSVSLFLQADGYNFDTIIFDEASQVCTEDAIGAIMRGKQVIIAGDTNQLPPTTFFSATLSDGDFDVDSDDEIDDTGAYDSILEEAVNAIPERTLKWHYRSRHEHLIAFSNAKIYKNQLITFPSNMDKVPDHGVEYIYVEDGVYDRGGKKSNLNEAKRVASLVFEHIRKYPNRSLGVVTFSEAQQQAVDSAIRQLRIQNSQYEKFFSEDNEDEFFVKNLENVQGDERDTIIFSIGYAKDHSGVMYMNFGPLSRTGGHRRLNVAITRAKHNVKLVGSIHPTDIKVENTNSEGVKMLRQYIEFAINGASVLQYELNYSNTIDVDSPFEEAVHDFLIKNGYNIVTQVGCSGYRIDMAVKHPTLSGIFVLGIECDGATYHSARTARERDRLRQTVLEDIGWTIYRIWSTDWIKDPKTEGNKLLEAVKKAISNYDVNRSNNTTEKPNDTSFVKEEYVTVEKTKKSNNNNPYDFDYYKETDIFRIPSASNETQYLANVIEHIVKQEYPIHYDLLCKRVAPLFGNQKVTVKVKSSVDYALNKYLNNLVIEKEDFCWHKHNNVIRVKIPSLNGESRPINYICTEEIAEAMFVIAGKSFGISREDLYVITARVFGFSRTGGNIIQAMERACLYLLNNGIVKEIDGKIV